MITKTANTLVNGRYLDEDILNKLKDNYAHGSLNNMYREVEAVKTVGSGIGGLLGGLGGSIGHKLLTANNLFSSGKGKALGTAGAMLAPLVGSAIGTSAGGNIGGQAITNAIRNERFHTENGRKLLPEKYKKNDLAALSTNATLKGGLVGAGGYASAKGLHKLMTGKPLVNSIMPKTIYGATGIGAGVGLGSALLSKALHNYSITSKEKYKV